MTKKTGNHRRRPSHKSTRPGVERLEPRIALTTFMVTNTGDSGTGSLRQAIINANFAGGGTIDFNIPGLGVHTIIPGSPLPTISRAITIDGTSQVGYAGTPLIEINGASAGKNTDGSAADGFQVRASSTTIEGLDINGFGGHGISIEIGNSDTVQACYLGVDPTGAVAVPNGSDAIFITNSSFDTIGGPAVANGNLISGNKGDAIHVLFGGSSNNLLFQNNFIGTDASGTVPLGNAGDGIDLFAASTQDQILDNVISGNSSAGISFFGNGPSNALIEGNLIGTDKAGTGPIGNGGSGIDDGGAPGTQILGNVISANDGAGVNLTFNTTVGTVVHGNLIGVAKDGVHALGNLGRGVAVNFGAFNAQIGGPNSGDGNVIAYNGKTFNDGGVELDTGSTGIAIEGNTIYSNYGIGIDLNGDGVTLNSPGGPHNGANNLQNFPVISSAASSALATAVSGTLNSASNTVYRLEFFGNPGPDPTGYGQGRVYLGSTTTTTDGSGNAAFNVVLLQSIPVGWYVSATATDPAGNTSEFSRDVTVPQLLVGLSVGLTPSADPVSVGDTLVYTVTVTNVGVDPATGVVLTDALPARVTYKSSTINPGSVSIAGTTVTGTVGTLAGGASATLTITVQAGSIGTFNNTVNATSTVGVTGSASTTTHITKSIPIVTVAPTIAQPVYGQAVTFTATVTPSGIGRPAPTGTVKFVLDGVVLDLAIPVVNGVAKSDIAPALLAGAHTISISYSGDANFAAVSPPQLLFTVAKVHLTVTADNKSRGLNAANPALTYKITGFINGDTATVVSGQPTLSTTAVVNSPAGAYPITVSLGTLSAINYDFPNLVNGTLNLRHGTPLDFQGVGHAEVSVFWPATAQWFGIGPQGGFLIGTFGATGLKDIPVAGDYYGTGLTEMAVFRPSTSQWFAMSPTGGRLVGTFGAPNLGDVPVPGDYDGVGHTELAVFRPSNSHWYVLGPNGVEDKGAFGAPNFGDIPVPGDYDGVGHTELAVFRPSNAHWYVLGPNGVEDKGAFGATNLADLPVPGDFDGVGHAELGVFRPATGQWFVLGPTGGHLVGISGVAVPADIPANAPTGSLLKMGLLNHISAFGVANTAGITAESVAKPTAKVTQAVPAGAAAYSAPKSRLLGATSLRGLVAQRLVPTDRG